MMPLIRKPLTLAWVCVTLFFVLLPLTLSKPGLPMLLKGDEPANYMMTVSLWHDGDLPLALGGSVERAIFCSTPQRGAEMASSVDGKLGTSVVRLPEELKEIGADIVSSDPDALTGGAAARRKFPDGVQSLQPDYDLVLALDTLPIDSRVTYHSIIGDRGKGDSPESSDGVVAYWIRLLARWSARRSCLPGTGHTGVRRESRS